MTRKGEGAGWCRLVEKGRPKLQLAVNVVNSQADSQNCPMSSDKEKLVMTEGGMLSASAASVSRRRASES